VDRLYSLVILEHLQVLMMFIPVSWVGAFMLRAQDAEWQG
jgi:hypothetical protein